MRSIDFTNKNNKYLEFWARTIKSMVIQGSSGATAASMKGNSKAVNFAAKEFSTSTKAQSI